MTLGYYLSSPWLVVAVATPAEGLTNAKETATVQDGTNESDATTGTNAIREVIQGKRTTPSSSISRMHVKMTSLGKRMN